MANKPIIFWPCILVYRVVYYAYVGTKVTIHCVLQLIRNFLRYLLIGFIVCCEGVYQIVHMIGMILFHFWKYVYFGILAIGLAVQIGYLFLYDHTLRKFVMIMIANHQERLARKDRRLRELEARRREKEALKEQTRLHNLSVVEEAQRIAEEQRREAEESELRKKQFIEGLEDEAAVEAMLESKQKKTFAQRLEAFFAAIGALPSKIKKVLNSPIGAEKKALREAEKHEALLIDLSKESGEKSDKKILFEYVAKNEDGKIVKGYFEAFSKLEVHSFLISQGFEVYSIRSSKWITFLHGDTGFGSVKIKTKDLIFFITQLSTYIKAGIPLVDSLKILTRQYKNPGYQKVFRTMMYDLTMGDSFSTALEKQGNAFPGLFVNMVKSSELTGELPEVLDDMEEYYTQTEKTKKQMVNALLYPCMVLFVAIVVIIFIMVYVIPQFVEIYSSMDPTAIPAFTLWILDCSHFLRDYGVFILIGVVIFFIIYIYLFKKVQPFRKSMQTILMKIPVLGDVVIYNEVTLFTKTLGSLMAHNVFITDSMEILNRITSNEIYKEMINKTLQNLSTGESISASFKGHWAFPVPAYEMLVTGEKTGELPEMMQKVSSYYQELHETAVARIKTFVEPILIVLLTGVVGVIVLAIVIPMFNMYNTIQE